MDGDTLALVPYPSNRLFIPKTLPAAVRHERELFHDIAVAWVTAFPGSAEALEALALSLDMLGDPSAVDSLHRARILAAAEPERVRIAGAEFWMRLRFSVPFDTRGTQAAKALADSLLSTNFAADTPEPLLLASIAVATGRANLAADFTRRPAAVEALRVPPPLARIAGPLLVFSALAGPLDSVRTLEAQTAATIENAIAAPQQIRARMSWLGRAGQLAFPDYKFESLPLLAGHGDYMIDAQVAFLRADSAAVRQMFDERRVRRRDLPPGLVTLDAIYPEAALLAAMGDTRGAVAWLDPTLAALFTVSTEKLADPANAGALLRAMMLRADLASQLGDLSTAARWAHAVVALWSGGDPAVQPVVNRMQRLAELSQHQNTVQ